MSSEATSANSHQIGGTHYRANFQHWDLMAANNVRYLEANSLKYLSRFRGKNGAQDLKKALHYIDKVIELSRDTESRRLMSYKPQTSEVCVDYPLPSPRSILYLDKFVKAVNLPIEEHLIFQILLSFTTLGELRVARELIQNLYNKEYGSETAS